MSELLSVAYKVWVRSQRARDGFTLVEVMVFAFGSSVVLVATLLGLTMAQRASQSSQEAYMACLKCRDAYERLRMQPFEDIEKTLHWDAASGSYTNSSIEEFIALGRHAELRGTGLLLTSAMPATNASGRAYYDVALSFAWNTRRGGGRCALTNTLRGEIHALR